MNLRMLWKGIVLLFKAQFAKRMLMEGKWSPNQARAFMGLEPYKEGGDARVPRS